MRNVLDTAMLAVDHALGGPVGEIAPAKREGGREITKKMTTIPAKKAYKQTDIALKAYLEAPSLALKVLQEARAAAEKAFKEATGIAVKVFLVARAKEREEAYQEAMERGKIDELLRLNWETSMHSKWEKWIRKIRNQWPYEKPRKILSREESNNIALAK